MMIQSGQNDGMMTMNTCLKNMCLNGIIDEKTMIESSYGDDMSTID
jgi:Tfp pilus assembly pilus retraction ATPase PilT